MVPLLFFAVILLTTIESSFLLSLPSSQETNQKNSFSTNQDAYGMNSIAKLCQRPFNRNEKHLTIKPSQSFYKNDHLIVLSCVTGPRKTHKCINGTWHPRFDWIGQCPSTNGSCSPVLPIKNGWYNSTDLNSPFSLGSKLDFKCRKGYSLTGAPAIVCEYGLKWSFQPPSCSSLNQNVTERHSTSKFFIRICLVSLLIILLISESFLAYKRYKRKKLRDQWRQYFNDYTYRSSKKSTQLIDL